MQGECRLNILYKVEQNFTSKIKEHVLDELYIFEKNIKIFLYKQYC